MLTTITLLLTLAAPDAGPAPISPEAIQEANIELNALAVMANPPQRQIVLSAVLCDARARLQATKQAIENGGLSKSLVRAEQAALRDEAGAKKELAARATLSLTCTEYETARLVTCLDAAAPFWCATDQRLAPVLRAAENLLESWRPRPVTPRPDAGVDAD